MNESWINECTNECITMFELPVSAQRFSSIMPSVHLVAIGTVEVVFGLHSVSLEMLTEHSLAGLPVGPTGFRQLFSVLKTVDVQEST